MQKIIALFSFAFLLCLASTARAEDKILARVNKNQEINCGVYILGAIFHYDENGKPTGFTKDLMDEVGARTGYKIRYTEISSFATITQDLEIGQYDMICSPVLFFPATAMKFLPGTFLGFDPINIYADGRAEVSGIKKLTDLNDPKYIFTGMDGELGGLYVPKLFPKAKLNLLPIGVPVANMFMEVHTRKANFVVLSRLAERAYLKDNPGKLKRVTSESIYMGSVRQFFSIDSPGLRANIDTVIEDMKRDGTYDRIAAKWDFAL